MKQERTLGIDIGGTKILVGILQPSMELSEISVFPTVSGDTAANLNILTSILEDPRYRNIAEVGVSVPTTIAPDGLLRDDYGFTGLGGLYLGTLLSNESRRVTVYTDVECGAIAESLMGAGNGIDNFLYVTVGTGLAHCLVVNGKPYTGSTGSGFFSGYMVPARCGNPECEEPDVESICSGSGIAKAYGVGKKAEIVFEQAEKGEAKAISVIEHAGWHMAAMIADLIHILNPGLVIIGGGLGSGSVRYREVITKWCRPLIKPVECKQVSIVPAALKSNSCLIGAAVQASRMGDICGRNQSGNTH